MARIVILGAGYAGLMAFLELQRQLGRDTDLTLVDRSDRHVFVTELPALVAGEEDEEDVSIPLRRIVRPPSRLVVDTVEQIDLSEQAVQLRKRTLPYDTLVVALGSQPEYFGLEGVKEHGVVVQNLRQAAEARDRLAEVADRKPDARVVIAGGGLTGVELCGDITDHYPKLRVTVIEAGPEIMNGFDPELIAFAKRVLTEREVQVLTKRRIKAVSDHACALSDGEALEFDLLIWAGGVRGNCVVEESGLDVTERGRGLVDAALHARGHPEIYLIGDCAAAVDRRTRRIYPPTAQIAVQAGRQAARNVMLRLAGRVEQPFRPVMRGMVASVGRRRGVAQVGQEHLAGAPAVWLKKLIEAQHAYEAGGLLALMRHVIHHGVGRNAPVKREAQARSGRMSAAQQHHARV